MTLDSSPSALPSPPTSPVSPRAATTRIRIKPKRASISTPDVLRTMSSLSMIVTDTEKPAPPTSPPIAKSKRRQSSITYYTPTSPSPWSHRHRRLPSSADGLRDEPSLVNGRERVAENESPAASRSSSAHESVSSMDGVTMERKPLTLVEKHADLLHFIAQKERKCLELRDQLAAHEKELAELKCTWERIVGDSSDAQNSSSASLGAAALDGLKEGVRMIAAGFSDFSEVIHELESADSTKSPPTRTRRPSHLSTSSVVFPIHEGAAGERAGSESLSRASSLNHRHKRTSRADPNPPTNPPSLDACALVCTHSPTMVPPHPPLETGSTWMDTMGRKLSGLQKSPTFSKSQKRASSFLAGVSSSINSALSPGPTATTPAPRPPSKSPNARARPRLRTQTLPEPHSNPNPTYGSTMDWLEDDAQDGEDGEHTMACGMVSPPPSVSSPPPSESSLQQRTSAAVSSFDDDTWNW